MDFDDPVSEVKTLAVSKEELHRLIDRIDNPVELESAYAAVKSIIDHDDQSWYWTKQWQEAEREVDADKSARQISPSFDSVEELMQHLLTEPEGEPRS